MFINKNLILLYSDIKDDIFCHRINMDMNYHDLLFTHKERENSWIQTLPKVISAMWNANGLFQGLNSTSRIHFLRWHPFGHERLYKKYTASNIYKRLLMYIQRRE